MKTTEHDRSESYDTDPLVRVIEDTVRSERSERRLYPDLYSEKVAEAIRNDPDAIAALAALVSPSTRWSTFRAWLTRFTTHA